MSTHLSEEQISQCIAGHTSGELDGHIRECAQCREKLESFQNIIAAYRVSAADWSNHASGWRAPHTSGFLRTFRQARVRSLRWMAAASAVTIIAIAAVVPVYKRSIEPPNNPAAAEESQLDAQLLQRVNAHLSQTAPASLQPLMEIQAAGNDFRSEGEHR